MSVFTGFFASDHPSAPPPPLSCSTLKSSSSPHQRQHHLIKHSTNKPLLSKPQIESEDEALYGPPEQSSSILHHHTSILHHQSLPTDQLTSSSTQSHSSSISPTSPADRLHSWDPDHLNSSSDELFLSEHYPPIQTRLYPFFNEKLSSPIGMGRGQPIISPALAPSYVSLSNIWRRIARILASRPYQLPELPDSLSYPAPQLALLNLDRLLAPFSLVLPNAVRDHFAVHDGQDVFTQSNSGPTGIIWGLWLMSCEEIEAEWGFWRRLDGGSMPGDAFAATDFVSQASVSHHDRLVDERMSSCPAGWVREVYSHPGWLPLLSDRVGNYIGVDLSPPGHPSYGPNNADDALSQARRLGGGQGHARPEAGQVIAFGREIDEKVVLWRGEGRDGWANWLASFADDLEEARFARLIGRRRLSGPRRRNSDGEDGWTPSDDEDEEEEDGLGEMGYFNDGSGIGGSDVEEEFQGWRLASEYRGMSVIEALCARSKKRWAEIGLYSSRVELSESVHSFGSQPSRTSRVAPDDHQSASVVAGPSSELCGQQSSSAAVGEDSAPPTPIAYVTPPSPSVEPELELESAQAPSIPVEPASGRSQAGPTKGLLPRSSAIGHKKHPKPCRPPPPVPASLDLPTMDSLLIESSRDPAEKEAEVDGTRGGTRLVSRLSIVSRRFSEEIGRRSSPVTSGNGVGAGGDVIGMGMIMNNRGSSGNGKGKSDNNSATRVGENGGLEILRTVV